MSCSKCKTKMLMLTNRTWWCMRCGSVMWLAGGEIHRSSPRLWKILDDPTNLMQIPKPLRLLVSLSVHGGGNEFDQAEVDVEVVTDADAGGYE